MDRVANLTGLNLLPLSNHRVEREEYEQMRQENLRQQKLHNFDKDLKKAIGMDVRAQSPMADFTVGPKKGSLYGKQVRESSMYRQKRYEKQRKHLDNLDELGRRRGIKSDSEEEAYAEDQRNVAARLRKAEIWQAKNKGRYDSSGSDFTRIGARGHGGTPNDEEQPKTGVLPRGRKGPPDIGAQEDKSNEREGQVVRRKRSQRRRYCDPEESTDSSNPDDTVKVFLDVRERTIVVNSDDADYDDTKSAADKRDARKLKRPRMIDGRVVIQSDIDSDESIPVQRPKKKAKITLTFRS